MKNYYKISLLIVAFALLLLSLCGCAYVSTESQSEEPLIVPEPAIKSGEFPFVLEYEYEGETYVIEDVVVCTYTGYITSGFYPRKPYKRTYDSYLKNGSDTVLLEIEQNAEDFVKEGRISESVVLRFGDGGYYLGDPDTTSFHPCIAHTERCIRFPTGILDGSTEVPLERLEEYYGIKLIRFEFSSPIENTFEDNN